MRSFILASALALLAPIAGHAADDLLDAYEAARRNDPRFQASRLEYEAAREKIPQAWAELLPQVTLDARRSRTNQNIVEREQPVFGTGKTQYTTREWQFRATQALFRYASWVQLDQSQAVVRQAYAQFAAAEQELILRVSALYLNLLASRDQVTLTEAELAAVGKQLELVKAQRRGGLASVTDEYEAEARYSLVTADVIEANYALDDAYQALREAVGDAIADVMPLQDEIPLVRPEPANAADWVEAALDQNLLLTARKEAVAVAQYEVDRIKAGHYPTVEFVASHGNVDADGAITGGATDTDTTVVGLQLNIPIYSGGVVNSRTREATKLFQRARQEQIQQHRQVMRETRAAYQGVISAISRVDALQASVRSQESALEGRQQGYRSGVNTLLDVLDTERELFSTRRDYLRARYEYLLNLLQLKRQAGSLSEEDLEYLNSLLRHGGGATASMMMVNPAAGTVDYVVTGSAGESVGELD
jgi:outer membrane protein